MVTERAESEEGEGTSKRRKRDKEVGAELTNNISCSVYLWSKATLMVNCLICAYQIEGALKAT